MVNFITFNNQPVIENFNGKDYQERENRSYHLFEWNTHASMKS